MDTWTKEQWAASWKGDILTDDGKQVVSEEETLIELTEEAYLKRKKTKIPEVYNKLK